MRHQAISETKSWLLQQHTYDYFLHFSFCFILIIPRLTELRPFKCQGQTVSLWRWPLTSNLEKCYSLRSSFGMYNLERWLRYLHLLTRHCPYNLLSSPWTFFWHNLRCFLHIWGQIEAVFNISKFSKWPPFWARDKLFLPEVIPEVEYTRKMAISISDILNFWSTL